MAPIRTLIVDDSAFARKVIREIVAAGAGIEVVGTARDGEEALELVASLRPDVVVTDLHMPRLNGVGFVRAQMAIRPLPILIVSSAAQDAEEVIDALNLGAVDVVQKPSALAMDDLRSVGAELVEKIRACVNAPFHQSGPGVSTHSSRIPVSRTKPTLGILVIGISTGGPQALRRLIPQFPADFPVPVAIVLHMPVGYTALYAEKLNEISALKVKEAEDGDLLVPGQVLVAQAGRHLTLRQTISGTVVAHLTLQPMDKLHRPSADVLFRSAAEIYKERVLGVVMTGMGDDGKEGAAWIKAQGGKVLIESEHSCVIYGMPRSVAEAGLSDGAFALDELAQAISVRL